MRWTNGREVGQIPQPLLVPLAGGEAQLVHVFEKGDFKNMHKLSWRLGRIPDLGEARSPCCDLLLFQFNGKEEIGGDLGWGA